MMFGGGGGSFNQEYSVYSIAMLDGSTYREDVDQGGKVIMPTSALEKLARLNIEYPMMFSIETRVKTTTHCGVLEFVAREGTINMPHWMMRNLALEEGARVRMRNVALPKATFAKFQPQHVDFLDLTNPKAILEKSLRNVSCLTEGDIIAITYNKKIYEILVMEVKPKSPFKAVSIVECDVELDFAPPLGYIEPDYKGMQAEARLREAQAQEEQELLSSSPAALPIPTGFQSFGGSGNRLDGKVSKTAASPLGLAPAISDAAQRDAERRARAAAAELRYQPGKLFFGKPGATTTASTTPPNPPSAATTPTAGATPGIQPFSGQGYTLKGGK